jgi:cytochrome c553
MVEEINAAGGHSDWLGTYGPGTAANKDSLIIQGGINDIVREHKTGEELLAGTQFLIEAGLAAGLTDILVMSIKPGRANAFAAAQIQIYRDGLPALCAQFNCVLVDDWDLFVAPVVPFGTSNNDYLDLAYWGGAGAWNNEMQGTDPLHMNSVGNTIRANNMAAVIEAIDDRDPTNNNRYSPNSAACVVCHEGGRGHMEGRGGSFDACQESDGTLRPRVDTCGPGGDKSGNLITEGGCVNCHGPGGQSDVAEKHRLNL